MCILAFTLRIYDDQHIKLLSLAKHACKWKTTSCNHQWGDLEIVTTLRCNNIPNNISWTQSQKDGQQDANWVVKKCMYVPCQTKWVDLLVSTSSASKTKWWGNKKGWYAFSVRRQHVRRGGPENIQERAPHGSNNQHVRGVAIRGPCLETCIAMKHV
jgi:hypothetical protein